MRKSLDETVPETKVLCNALGLDKEELLSMLKGGDTDSEFDDVSDKEAEDWINMSRDNGEPDADYGATTHHGTAGSAAAGSSDLVPSSAAQTAGDADGSSNARNSSGHNSESSGGDSGTSRSPDAEIEELLAAAVESRREERRTELVEIIKKGVLNKSFRMECVLGEINRS